MLGSNKDPVQDSTSNEKYWPTGGGWEANGDDEKKPRRHDPCYEKRLNKMRPFSPEK